MLASSTALPLSYETHTGDLSVDESAQDMKLTQQN
jgi:hypothetical protein